MFPKWIANDAFRQSPAIIAVADSLLTPSWKHYHQMIKPSPVGEGLLAKALLKGKQL